MTTVLADPAARQEAPAADQLRLLGGETAGAGHGSTLEDLVSSAWEDLSARALAACPVCGGEMAGAGRVAEARCHSCGSELS